MPVTADGKQGLEATRATRTALLLDDHAIVREGIKALIELDGELTVIAECGQLADALRLARELKPDIIITDLMIPGVAGSQGIAELRQQCPDTRIVVLSVSSSHERIRSALEAGANGYVLKDASRQELFRVVHGVLNGERSLCSKSSEVMLSQMLAGSTTSAQNPNPTASVSGRERMVIELIAAGASTKRIAAELDLSVKTVEKHRYNAMRKLGLRNVAQVTRFAIDSGMISPDRTGRTGRFRRLSEDTLPPLEQNPAKT